MQDAAVYWLDAAIHDRNAAVCMQHAITCKKHAAVRIWDTAGETQPSAMKRSSLQVLEINLSQVFIESIQQDRNFRKKCPFAMEINATHLARFRLTFKAVFTCIPEAGCRRGWDPVHIPNIGMAESQQTIQAFHILTLMGLILHLLNNYIYANVTKSVPKSMHRIVTVLNANGMPMMTKSRNGKISGILLVKV
uniref:Uncharacterized protein n=1 Tax=Romanomermis culicivorax TaxID=13658 RepID=A0A915L8D3_ROMCU